MSQHKTRSVRVSITAINPDFFKNCTQGAENESPRKVYTSASVLLILDSWPLTREFFSALDAIKFQPVALEYNQGIAGVLKSIRENPNIKAVLISTRFALLYKHMAGVTLKELVAVIKKLPERPLVIIIGHEPSCRQCAADAEADEFHCLLDSEFRDFERRVERLNRIILNGQPEPKHKKAHTVKKS